MQSVIGKYDFVVSHDIRQSDCFGLKTPFARTKKGNAGVQNASLIYLKKNVQKVNCSHLITTRKTSFPPFSRSPFRPSQIQLFKSNFTAAQPIRVPITESAGRGVFATRTIGAGELIHAANPMSLTVLDLSLQQPVFAILQQPVFAICASEFSETELHLNARNNLRRCRWHRGRNATIHEIVSGTARDLVPHPDREDKGIWTQTPSGIYSAKSSWMAI
ncbi:uncharacterized protein LOC131332997 [Rhododendron vialii]|uniref:uncharacterized protein LOC131332997 n=1 Tax=Rhododendron vialii TaxID=182163 RepID=UPI00266030DD|nr:uncharacterized protein LOC131332997 [Rhododendron vialii]